jgi:hypothetical protein
MTERRSSSSSDLRFLAVIGVAAGCWLLASPFVLGLTWRYPHQLAAVSALVVGAAVLLLSLLHMLQWQRARAGERINVGLGLFYAASPVFFGYSQFGGAGHAATLSAVLSGAAIVAGAALALAGSDPGAPTADAPSLSRPVLWPEPPAGRQPQAFTRRAAEPTARQAERTKPWAWASVGLLIAAAIVLGVAFVLRGGLLASGGTVLAVAGVLIAWRGRAMAAVSLSQHPTER